VEVTEQIIIAIKSSDGYEYSELGYTITIENLDELLPEVSRHLIVAAIVEMEGVEVIDSSTGAVFFPSGYFK
jgi:formylmethanofuran dehydrogenase subunit A